PAPARLHQAGLRPRHDGRAAGALRGTRAGARVGAGGLQGLAPRGSSFEYPGRRRQRRGLIQPEEPLMPQNDTIKDLDLDLYKYDFISQTKPSFRAEKGLSEEVVRQISQHKEEPEWMLDLRLRALEIYNAKPMPTWGGDLSTLEETLDEIYFYVRPQDRMERSWDDVPTEIKDTFEKLGIPEAERKILAGVGAQYESEMVYHSLREE